MALIWRVEKECDEWNCVEIRATWSGTACIENFWWIEAADLFLLCIFIGNLLVRGSNTSSKWESILTNHIESICKESNNQSIKWKWPKGDKERSARPMKANEQFLVNIKCIEISHTFIWMSTFHHFLHEKRRFGVWPLKLDWYSKQGNAFYVVKMCSVCAVFSRTKLTDKFKQSAYFNGKNMFEHVQLNNNAVRSHTLTHMS